MALKKRFREATRNEFRFFCFSSVLSGLDDCYYCSNIIYLYFSSFVPSPSLIWWGKQKLWHAVQKPDYVCLISKIFKNHQFIFLSWSFYTAWSIQFLTFHMFWVFLFELQNCTWKINLYNMSSLADYLNVY